MNRSRRTSRPTAHSTLRRAIRVRWRAPDELGIVLAAYRRAIRAHRRLARLAPSHFDSTVIERERAESEARRRWNEAAEQAIAKIYGTEPKPLPEPDPPPLPPPRICAAVERELAACRLWLDIGRDALQRFRIRRPHALPELGRVARMLEIGNDFGRLATGAPAQPKPEPGVYTTAWADLHRIYGDPPSEEGALLQRPGLEAQRRTL